MCAQTAGYCDKTGEEKPELNWGVSGDEGKEKTLGCSHIVTCFYLHVRITKIFDLKDLCRLFFLEFDLVSPSLHLSIVSPVDKWK